MGLPTETVYGLAADAENAAAVAQIFVAKGRPADHPLIVHVANPAAAAHFASPLPDFAQTLMAAFWPGPLTLILPRRPGAASAAAGGHATVGLRCPAHPVALTLLKALAKDAPGIASDAQPAKDSQATASCVADAARHDGQHVVVWGIAAPSANLFGRVSPTTAAHVQAEFGDDLLILDGGPCHVGIESTIIDCTRGQPVLLRPGAITPAQVQAVCGLKVLLKEELPALTAPAPKASGTLESHYAPQARVRLMDAPALQAALKALAGEPEAPVASGRSGPAIAVWARTVLAAPAGLVLHQAMPHDADTAARQLFAQLREFDDLGVRQIWIETPPQACEWDGVRDRLQRAAS